MDIPPRLAAADCAAQILLGYPLFFGELCLPGGFLTAAQRRGDCPQRGKGQAAPYLGGSQGVNTTETGGW